MNELYDFPGASRLTETNPWVLWWRETRPKQICQLSYHSGRDTYLSRLKRQAEFFLLETAGLRKFMTGFSASRKSAKMKFCG